MPGGAPGPNSRHSTSWEGTDVIHELRVYTVHTGQQPAFLKLAAEKAMPIRGNDYGKCLGYWTSEHGPLNQVFHMWEYEDLNQRAAIRAKLGQNQAWIKEYVAQVQPLIRQQYVRLMHPILPFKAPAGQGNVYEFRNYKAAIGKAAPWAKAFQEIMPVREKHSKNVGAWTVESPEPNEVCHLWAYPSLNQRLETRAKVAADPEWQAFLKTVAGMLVEMHSTVLVPAPFSPLK
jgi:hypothetical protein